MSKFNVFPHFCAVAVLASFLSACGGGSGGDGVVGTGNSPDGSSIHVDGAAQKGPYLKGSEVLVSALSATGVPSTDTTLSEIQDDMGTFAFQVAQPGPVLIAADGYHFNEITGSLSQGRLLLRAVYNATSDAQQKAYVNVLTHLSYKRTLTLLSQGTAITDAMHQAEADILQALRTVLPVSDVTDFTQLSIYNTDTSYALGNAYVLALSATVYEAAILRQRQNSQSSVDAQLTALLNDLSDDVADDGQISRVTFSGNVPQNIEPPASSTINYTSPPPPMDLLQELIQATRHVRPDQVRTNLENRSLAIVGQKLPVADLDLFLDSDGDGMVNAQDNDDDNDGIADAEDASPYVYSEAPLLIPSAATGGVSSKTPFTLEWTTSEYAKQIEVQLAKDDAFTDIVLDELAPTKQYSFTLDAGIYHVRARAQNELGGWGPWSLATELPVDAFARAYVFPDSTAIRPQTIIPTNNGGFLVTGYPSELPGVGGSEHMLLKMDAAGAVQWARPTDWINWTQAQFSKALWQLDNEDMIFVTTDNGIFQHSLQRLVKLDRDGNQLWRSDSLEPGNFPDRSVTIATALVESDGYVVGMTWHWQEATANGGVRERQSPLVVKVDLLGNITWRFDFNESTDAYRELTGMWKAADGTYRIAGYLNDRNSHFLASLTPDGKGQSTISTTATGKLGAMAAVALPDNSGGFLLATEARVEGALLRISETGDVQFAKYLNVGCSCNFVNPMFFADPETFTYGGNLYSLDGGPSAWDWKAFVVTRVKIDDGSTVDRRVYELDAADPALTALDMEHEFKTFTSLANADLRILGTLDKRDDPDNTVRGFVVVKPDPSGYAPKTVSQVISVTP